MKVLSHSTTYLKSLLIMLMVKTYEKGLICRFAIGRLSYFQKGPHLCFLNLLLQTSSMLLKGETKTMRVPEIKSSMEILIPEFYLHSIFQFYIYACCMGVIGLFSLLLSSSLVLCKLNFVVVVQFSTTSLAIIILWFCYQ